MKLNKFFKVVVTLSFTLLIISGVIIGGVINPKEIAVIAGGIKEQAVHMVPFVF